MGSGRYPDNGGGSSLVPDPWYAARVAEMLAVLPTLTSFEFFHLSPDGLGSSLATLSTNDAAVEGGGKTGATGGALLAFSGALTHKPKTGPFAIVFRAKFALPASGHTNYIALINSASNTGIDFGPLFSIDPTHWVMQLFAGGLTTNVVSTTAADANWHNFMVTTSGTTVSLYVDNVIVATTTTLTNLADTGVLAAISNTTAGDTILTKFSYGYQP